MLGIVSSFIVDSGQTLIIHNNWKENNASSIEVRGLKNSRNGKAIFQFDERFEIKRGTVIQPKATEDFWLVEDTEDKIIYDEFDHIDVFVKKIAGNGSLISNPERKINKVTVINNAPVYGQQFGDKNIQKIKINSEQNISEIITSLRSLLNNASTISELEKEDAVEALDRVSKLTQKEEKTSDVLERASSRLSKIESIVSKSQSLYEKVKPAILAMKIYFGLTEASE